MKQVHKVRKILFAAFLAALLACLFCQPAFAITESDVQAQVDASSKEAVAGNVLVWFLCAIAFLKVSQKIDSFMSSLGVNVGHTGGNMLAEAMIAARGIGGIRNFSSQYFGGGRGSSSTHVNSNGSASKGAGGSFMGGGLVGVISRSVTNSAVKTATAPADSATNSHGSSGLGGLVAAASSGLGGHMYSSSVKSGGEFANNIIGSVASGSIASVGSMSGENAAQALQSYMGYTALEDGAENIPVFSNVEIGGGRITGTEVSEEHPEGISFGMYHADQYMAPQGAYTTVQSADGTSWYKQYAADVVEKNPYMAPDGSIAYNEAIVKRLPQPPRRKERM